MPNVVRLKATCSEQIVGFIAGDIRRSERVSWIATIGVLPEYRRKGIGRALLETCEADIPTAAIRLSVRPENLSAIRLYENMGYKQVDTWQNYYQDGSDALVMEKVREIGL